jgi:hypothetical protein
MRKFMRGVAIATFLMAGGCASISPNGTITLTPTGQTVVSDIKGVCNIAADLTAITTLISTFPIGTTAAVIAQDFCQTVNALPLSARFKAAAPGAPTAVVINGVTVPYTRLGAKLKSRFSRVTVDGVAVPYVRR